MSGSTLALIIIPIVIAGCLTFWISMVFHAERHPGTGRGGVPDREVTGGIFRGDPRQWSPRRDAPVEEPSLETTSEDTTEVTDPARRGRR